MGLISKASGRNALRKLVPLALRKRMAVWVHQQEWVNADRRNWWSMELVRDLSEQDPNSFHKFLWAHHMAYAAPYEVKSRFGTEKMRPSRGMFFADMRSCMQAAGISTLNIRSVLEVGCSLGYQLRYLETDVFSEATRLEGIDIDEYAVRAGQEYLSGIGSKVSLICGDIQDSDELRGERVYDLILCTGVLMYLKEEDAAGLVRTMLSGSPTMLALAGLAHPSVDNANLSCSCIRESDHTFIHNLDEMVKKGGGRILARRWDGNRKVEGQSIYFVFAAPSKRVEKRGY
jgi:2-polyprenyl-3-methyl-5-hydroxy-6-metoxy-1,4-benzoquinol methylase